MKNTVIATPPGGLIKEQLEIRKMRQSLFSQMMNLSENDTIALLEGKLEITLSVAEALEKTFGIPARFWLKLEAIYQNKLKILRGEQCNAQ